MGCVGLLAHETWYVAILMAELCYFPGSKD